MKLSFWVCDDDSVDCDNGVGGIDYPICPEGPTDPTDPANPPLDPSCFNGDTEHSAFLIDGWCASYEVKLHTDTLAEAESCADQLKTWAESDPQVTQPVETGLNVPNDTESCKDVNDPFGTLTFHHYSSAQLESCQSQWCWDCEWAPGSCPGAP